jgi:hypothetical protein
LAQRVSDYLVHFDMWGDDYGQFNSASILGISKQKVLMKFDSKP